MGNLHMFKERNPSSLSDLRVLLGSMLGITLGGVVWNIVYWRNGILLTTIFTDC